ncbi:U7 snRNA-associated Sm-like protein LSm10 [Adelges cooleyi]|uniref:U7 snRNA-associated Sm-like protein LSm10 n=1 Tax=Adelges cooleyi TaxID=133065 RepID=UPI002180775E|nr:U7 snRNA-associated Sm-like protein LSm10 [Adelges cooleyi]
MEKKSRRNKMKSIESLVCLARAVENQHTTIDLQNETSVYGFIEEVDCDMNITMCDVTFTDANGKRFSSDKLFLKSRLIRYIHLPPNMDVFTSMREVIKKTFPPKIKTSSYSFKKKKIAAKHEKLKKEVQSMKETLKRQ